ncbi:hypothetical protein MUB24_07835 [Lederbergia sp. NSJ-179]|uniref:hypothetical protein n=1 Tax=Lederbergia sp. NSJ-179 TaxID=2931402 RepID=UPI001FD16889|nr:hypothetical protein [Lederbergia sp. NSJ-179]MCJ7840815.1 hypothetical protein [Lederbergia sp. NSJ-179]
MSLFGYPIETIYLVLLVISGTLTLLYLFFGDVLEGADEVSPFLNPVLILAFITFFSAGGFILEKVTALNSFLIIIIAAFISILLDVLLNVFVLIPLKSAEQSLSYTEKSLEGRVGKAIVSIPTQGFGEVVIESYSGMISKPAASYENTSILEGTEVLVIEVKEGVLYVVPYQPSFK